jgi:hypothetical protein
MLRAMESTTLIATHRRRGFASAAASAADSASLEPPFLAAGRSGSP